jgi:hypothetical protein
VKKVPSIEFSVVAHVCLPRLEEVRTPHEQFPDKETAWRVEIFRE